MNKVILSGNTGDEPDIRTTPSGQMVANVSLCVNERWTDREGQRQEKANWFRLVAWGKSAELFQRYVTKGKRILVEGRLQQRQWQDQETGKARTAVEVLVERVEFIDSAPRGDQGSEPRAPASRPSNGGGGGQGGKPRQGGQEPQGPSGGPDDPGYFDDDVPF